MKNLEDEVLTNETEVNTKAQEHLNASQLDDLGERMSRAQIESDKVKTSKDDKMKKVEIDKSRHPRKN